MNNNKKWSRKYLCCVRCKTTKIKYKGNGLCVSCYDSDRKKNPKSREAQVRYRNKHRKEIRIRQKEYHKQNREELFCLLGNKCFNCGFSDRRALQIDHINGGGIKERINYNTKDFHRVVLKSIKNNERKYQLLCANCNWIKRHEKQEWGGAKRKS